MKPFLALGRASVSNAAHRDKMRKTSMAIGANGLNVTLDAQLVADIKSIAPAVKVAVPVTPAQ